MVLIVLMMNVSTYLCVTVPSSGLILFFVFLTVIV